MLNSWIIHLFCGCIGRYSGKKAQFKLSTMKSGAAERRPVGTLASTETTYTLPALLVVRSDAHRFSMVSIRPQRHVLRARFASNTDGDRCLPHSCPPTQTFYRNMSILI